MDFNYAEQILRVPRKYENVILIIILATHVKMKL